MAVIIPDMNIPNRCDECELGLPAQYCPFLGIDTDDMDSRDMNCPLRSTDEMIAEIEDTYIDNCNYDYQAAVDIIHKYCDKDIKDEYTE